MSLDRGVRQFAQDIQPGGLSCECPKLPSPIRREKGTPYVGHLDLICIVETTVIVASHSRARRIARAISS